MLVGWLRTARNPQRERKGPGSAPAGSVNLKTGKPSLRTGYAPATINHALTVMHGFYSFHGRFGGGQATPSVKIAFGPSPVARDRAATRPENSASASANSR